MKLHLVRHTAVDVVPGTCYGVSDVPLAKSFPEEAQKVKEQLDALPIDCAFTSPLSRCLRLASFCGFSQAMVDPRLQERDFGAWEGLLYEEIQDDRLQLWYADFVHVRATDGESFIDVARRVQSFIDDLTQRFGSKQEIVLFTHGGVITAFQFCVERCSLDSIFDLQVPYGTIISLEIA